MPSWLEEFAFVVAAGAYLSVLLVTVSHILNKKDPPTRLNFVIIACGCLIQTFGLWVRGMEAGSCPVRNLFEILQFVSWAIVLMYLFTGPVFRMSCFGTAASSLAAILSIIAFIISSWRPEPGERLFGHNPLVESHAAIALLSYGVFGLLAVISTLYLLQSYSLKKKRYPAFFRFLPSIMDMETVLFRLLVFACIIFTIAVGIGAYYLITEDAVIATPKAIFTTILWLAYVITLALRLTNRLYATALPWVCIALFIAALLTLWPVEASTSLISYSAVICFSIPHAR